MNIFIKTRTDVLHNMVRLAALHRMDSYQSRNQVAKNSDEHQIL